MRASADQSSKDVLGLRLDVVSWEEDGHYENVVSGAGFGGGEGLGAALTALWTPAETFRAKARVSYTDDEYAPRSVILSQPARHRARSGSCEC